MGYLLKRLAQKSVFLVSRTQATLIYFIQFHFSETPCSIDLAFYKYSHSTQG